MQKIFFYYTTMNNKILTGVLLIGIAASGFASISSADDQDTWSITNTPSFERMWKMHGKHFKKMFYSQLSEEEQTAVEAMSNEEKQAFFEEKRNEKKAEKEAREAIIDALLAGETLSQEQEVLRQEIIDDRAERKAQRAEMEAKREQIKTILDKKENGESLTEAEEELLEEMKEYRKNHKHGKR